MERDDNPLKYETQGLFFQIDGKVERSEELYSRFLNKFLILKAHPFIEDETRKKINSAIRYFRLGTEAIEIEQKFINYWIGIEYLFSSKIAGDNTFQRFKDFFSKVHGLSYVKRNLIEFHKQTLISDGATALSDIDDRLDYLLDVNTYNKLSMECLSIDPFLAFKAEVFSGVMGDDKTMRLYIKKHVTNLEQHLVRMYRVRNEIIHEAAIKPNIESLTSNLRYYLIFTINTMVDFFEKPMTEIIINRQISIQDFFVFKSMEFEILLKATDIKHRAFNSSYNENLAS